LTVFGVQDTSNDAKVSIYRVIRSWRTPSDISADFVEEIIYCTFLHSKAREYLALLLYEGMRYHAMMPVGEHVGDL